MKITLVYTKDRGWHRNDRFCMNCWKELDTGDAHFVPPSLGEAGFYTCEKRSTDILGMTIT